MKKPLIVSIIVILIILVMTITTLLINLSFPTKNLPNEAIEYINLLSEENPEDIDFLKASWLDIKERFTGKKRCWRNYFWRNWIYSGKRIWKLEGDCLTCNLHNNLFQAYLLESQRFNHSQIKTKIGFCKEATMLHIYSIVTLKNQTKINIDSWGADFNVSFGSTIQEEETCNK